MGETRYSSTSTSGMVSVPWKEFLSEESCPCWDGLLWKMRICSPDSVPLRQEFPLKRSPHRVLLTWRNLNIGFTVLQSAQMFFFWQYSLRPSAYKDSVPHFSSHILSQQETWWPQNRNFMDLLLFNTWSSRIWEAKYLIHKTHCLTMVACCIGQHVSPEPASNHTSILPERAAHPSVRYTLPQPCTNQQCGEPSLLSSHIREPSSESLKMILIITQAYWRQCWTELRSRTSESLSRTSQFWAIRILSKM